MEPHTEFHRAGSEENKARGEALIDRGEVACLILAGGQGTRLGFDGPKGLFLLGETTPFDIFLRQARGIPMAVMASPHNREKTAAFFAGTGVHVFEQGVLPFLDEEGSELEAMGPDGNGGALSHLAESGVLEKWKQEGVKYLNIIPVDNVLADPADVEMVGLCERMEAEIVLKAIERDDLQEKVGVIAKGPRVVEYSEMSAGPEFRLANLGIFCLSLAFAERMAEVELPLHRAHKRIPELDRWGIKQEKFLFDILPHAKRAEVLVDSRKKCFLPLKEPGDVEKILACDIIVKNF